MKNKEIIRVIITQNDGAVVEGGFCDSANVEVILVDWCVYNSKADPDNGVFEVTDELGYVSYPEVRELLLFEEEAMPLETKQAIKLYEKQER